MARSGGGEGANGGGVKKGPWTQAEDKLLVDHVRRHGVGNWNNVRRETGLLRCGKSCRLRWANHLRPNLRKGPFSPEEERHILILHGLVGNKWAHISSHLPGRTDNEIKNYWNTRHKRRQRSGQPLYPPDVEQDIAILRAQNFNPLADGDAAHANANANANLQPPPLLYDAGNPFVVALPPTATASHSPLINQQNYALLNQQMQVFHHLGGSQHQQQQQLAPFHHDAGSSELAPFGGIVVPSGLPPLPRLQLAAELPLNQQFETSNSVSGSGGGGMLESMLIGDEHLLLRPNPGMGMVKVPSMPALSYREPAGGSRLLPTHCVGNDGGDVSSHSNCPPGEDLHGHGATWDFTFEAVKPAKRRTASDVGISDMFAATAPHEDWFGGGSTAPSPVPSSATAVTDDEFNLQEMQQLVSLLPLSFDEHEHGWNTYNAAG